VLVNNLKSVNKSAADLEEKLNAYSETLQSLSSEMQSLETALINTAKGNSTKFSEYIDYKKKELYKDCTLFKKFTSARVEDCQSKAARKLDKKSSEFKRKA